MIAVMMYCIIWKPEDKWELFTNQVFLMEEEAEDFAKRSNLKKYGKKIPYKIADAAEWF